MIEIIREFLKATGISEAAFGALTMNDVQLVDKIRRGKPLTEDARNRVLLFIENYDEAHN